MIGTTLRFEVTKGALPLVLQATRIYQRLTRSEPGNVRCELWQSPGDLNALVLSEAFRDDPARTEHAMAPYTRAWHEVLAQVLAEPIREEELQSLLAAASPPPLPFRQRPALESSTRYGTELVESRQPSPEPAPKLPQLTLDLEVIEVAAARDHLPLSAPESCVVVGAFVLNEAGAHGIGRAVYRFKPAKSLPASLVGVQRLLDVPVAMAQLPLKLALVFMSVEENGGEDVQALYRALADAHELSFWPQHADYPAPASLVDGHDASYPPNAAHRVQVLRRGQTLADALEDDTWAGAALGYFELTPSRPERLARFHTASDDGKNDWLFSVRCRIT